MIKETRDDELSGMHLLQWGRTRGDGTEIEVVIKYMPGVERYADSMRQALGEALRALDDRDDPEGGK